jgi:hypothetical protein
MPKIQVMQLTTEQLRALHTLSEKHAGKAHLAQTAYGQPVEVEFEFPFRYLISLAGGVTRVVI